MITCFLQGGLGNQMFQIASAYALSLELNTEVIFDFNSCLTLNQGNPSSKYANNFFKKIPNSKINFNFFKIYREPKFSFQKLPLIDNLILYGFFQSGKYFENYKNEIKNLFYFDEEIKNEVNKFLFNVKKDHQLTVVHVRRGDYLSKLGFHAPKPLEYFKSAINKIDGGNFVFISDDLQWCKEKFKGNNYFFPEFNSEIHDLYLMSQCDNVIMSNSSFSWWGVYLNENTNIVFSPLEWFGPEGPKDIEDIYDKNWIRL